MNRQRCTKHNALVHDFFISYRVSEDKINAEKLAAHIDEKRKPDGHNFVTYLDKNCLIQGLDWEVGFTYGIRNSKVLLLLISRGTIETMIKKARRGEVDNVLKEHKEALTLKAHGRVIVPVLVASLDKNKAGRTCYVKLDREDALRQFDTDTDNPEVNGRLQEIKRILASFFDLPTVVNMEPDSIQEQIPKILQIWYAEVSQVSALSCVSNATMKATEPNWFQRSIQYPTQSFRLTFIGAIIGFLGMFVTLSLLFMHSKSKSHTDLKYGIALGNIFAFVVIILACIILCAQFFFLSSSIYCTSCESVAVDYSNASNSYFNTIPDIDRFVSSCEDECFIEGSSDDAKLYGDCLACVCADVYQECEFSYAVSITLLVVIALEALLIIGTGLVTSRFKQTESFSMSLQ